MQETSLQRSLHILMELKEERVKRVETLEKALGAAKQERKLVRYVERLSELVLEYSWRRFCVLCSGIPPGKVVQMTVRWEPG